MLVLPHPTLQILHRYCSEEFEPPSLRFEHNAHGKPQLSWEEADGQPDPPIHFSLTHTSSLLGKMTALPASYSANLLMAYHTMHNLTDLLDLRIKTCNLTTGCTVLPKHCHKYISSGRNCKAHAPSCNSWSISRSTSLD